MHRFLVPPPLALDSTSLELSEEVSRHVSVLRLRVGDTIGLFDGAGSQVSARLTAVSSRSCQVVIVGGPERRVSRTDLHLVVALPKADKLETIVRMATELGVTCIHPAISDRAVPLLREGRWERRIDRLQRIANEAAEQCGRADVPVIRSPEALLGIAALAPVSARRFVCWEEDREALVTSTHLTTEAWVVVGPEGGLAPGEIAALDALGYMRLGLGQWVLRVDTAAVAALTRALGLCAPRSHG